MLRAALPPMTRFSVNRVMSPEQLSNYQAALKVLQTLRAGGHQAYLVGGCVRDRLLGLPCDEHDVATDAPPQRIRRLFARTHQVGAKFGVVLVRVGKHWIEVATFRAEETYSDGRHPDRVRFTDAREDAIRRDFTVNGMFLDPADGKVIDYVGGREDLRNRLVRAIGDPDQRFAEDHLRMLRAVRFATRLDFRIEPKTAAAVKRHAAKITTISAERIREELTKILSLPARRRGIELAFELGLLQHILPELTALRNVPASSWARSAAQNPPENAFSETLAVLHHLPVQPALPLSSAALLHLVGLTRTAEIDCTTAVRPRPPANKLNASAAIAEKVCRRLTYSNDERERTIWLVQFLPMIRRPQRMQPADIKRMMLYEQFDPLNALYSARTKAGMENETQFQSLQMRASAIDREQLKAPALINGNDLQQLRIPQGPIYQQILDTVYDMQLNEQVRTRRQALVAARQLVKRLA